MNKKTIDQLVLKDKVVLIRVDFNVPIKKGKVQSDKRIVEALPTIKKAIKDKAKVVVFSHLGRVESLKDKVDKDSSLKVVSKVLAEKLKKDVNFIAETRGPKLEKAIKALKSGEVLMFENTRFEDVDASGKLVKLESKNNDELGKYWASLGDVFINDAFGTAHRSAASNVGIASNIKESAVGYLMEKELSALSKGLDKPLKPFVAIVGGAKVSDKIAVIENLLKKADKVLIGGGMSYTFLSAQGYKIGNSLVEKEFLPLAKELLKKAKGKIVLPIDHAISSKFADEKRIVTTGKDAINVPDGYMGLDLGPKSINLYAEALKGAKTVVWNGPMGVAEFENFKQGTEAVATAITKQKDAFSIIGGGDSAAAAINLGFEKKFSHISTGGGASLEYMEGKTLPGVAAIQDASECSEECKEAPVAKKAVVKKPTVKSVAKKAVANKPAAKKPVVKKVTKK